MSRIKANDSYEEEYFKDRHNDQDPKRELSYVQEYERINEYISSGSVLDVGCGMGNFLDLFKEGWIKYGIEISKYASKIAGQKGTRMIDFQFESKSMDLIIFRGTLQHLTTPLWCIRECIRMLKYGGYMIFLATPNTNSLYYRLFQELPALDPPRNFLLPSDIMLKQILQNLGMSVLKIEYPYLRSPYCNIIRDHMKFILRFLKINKRFAFWGNMMECYARRTEDE
jgi:SAM-dependent methyltransferase